MAIPSHVVTVSRPTVDLDITATPYQLVRWFPPDVLAWRTVAIVGRYQGGERLVSAVPDVVIIGGVFRCLGDTWADVVDAQLELQLALQQFEYTVTSDIEGVAETFTNCQPANMVPLDGERTAGEVAEGFADFEIRIRCTPNIAVEGS